MSFVYKLTNKINGTVYIGKANDVENRVYEHQYYAKGGREKWGTRFLVVDAAIAKYGFDNFSVEVLHETITEDEAYRLEELEIQSHKESNKRLYNVGDGGKTNSGWKHSLEILKKMSHSQKQAYLHGRENPIPIKRGDARPKEWVQKTAISNRGKKRDQSMKYKNSLNKRGENNPFVKLTESKVLEIRQLISEGKSNKDIAKLYGVDHTTIRNIRNGKTWRHLL